MLTGQFVYFLLQIVYPREGKGNGFTKTSQEPKEIKTIEDLAELMIRTMASKEDIQALDKKVTEGFERIEHLLLAEQKREIEDLKTRMKRLEDALAV